MKDAYDAIVIGAGPAGLTVAKVLTARGLECLVIEQNNEIGQPVSTSGASWFSDMIKLGIPEAYLNPIFRVTIVAPNEEVTTSFEEPSACILDVSAVYKFLASQAQQNGAELVLGTKAKDVFLEDGYVKGVRTEIDSRLRIVKSKAVVDASGMAAVFVRKLGFLRNWTRRGVGVQYNVECSGIDSHRAVLFLGRKVAPSGYGWFFPWKSDLARVGVGMIRPDTNANPDSFAKDLLANVSVLYGQRFKVLGKETGVFPCSGALDAMVTNGFLAVGDAAGQGSPLHGEGIRYAIRFGMIAGLTIGDAILAKDVSKRRLVKYENEWRKLEGRNARVGLAIQKRISKHTDSQWDRNVKYLKELEAKDKEMLVQLFKSDFSYKNMWRVFKHSPSKALKMLLRSG